MYKRQTAASLVRLTSKAVPKAVEVLVGLMLRGRMDVKDAFKYIAAVIAVGGMVLLVVALDYGASQRRVLLVRLFVEFF